MNNREVQAAINDFRKAFREDLGCPISYGVRSFVPNNGGFSIDKKKTAVITWVDKTPDTKHALYATVQSATKEQLLDYGLQTTCTGIVTCIYEDILDLQPVKEGEKRLEKERVTKDVLRVFRKGYTEEFEIVDFTFAFELRDTFIFLKFGVVDASTGGGLSG